MDDKTLYPVDYEEREPEGAAKWAAERDETAALALIRAAVPKGGKPLTHEQLRALVCGRQPQYATAAQGPDPSVDLPAALEALAQGLPVVGPASCASFRPEEVDALIAKVADERRASWKPRAVAALEVEEK
jgi:hypothetical protein